MKRLILASIIFALLSCRKDDGAIDFDVKRNNIVGDWEITQVTQEIRADTLYAESSNTLSISFYQDGTGTKEVFIGTDVDIEWLYQYNPEKVVITGAPSGPLILGSVQFYNIIKNEKNRQIWKFEVVPKNGVVDVYKLTWKMDRK